MTGQYSIVHMNHALVHQSASGCLRACRDPGPRTRGGGTLPEYFPPLFLFTKHTVSSVSVRAATAHISPMNQPCVEMWSYRPACPATQRGGARSVRQAAPGRRPRGALGVASESIDSRGDTREHRLCPPEGPSARDGKDVSWGQH